jgi:hypothetical protein
MARPQGQCHTILFSFTRYQGHPPREEDVTLKMCAIRGETLTTFIQKGMPQGGHAVRFNGDDLASGLYFYALQSGVQVRS